MKKEMNKKKKINSKGFTLVEVLAAVAIVAILGTVGTPLVTRTIQTSKGKSYYVTAKSFKKAASSICYEGSELSADTLNNDVSSDDFNVVLGGSTNEKSSEITLIPANNKYKNMILTNYDTDTYTYNKENNSISFTVNCKGTTSVSRAPENENNVPKNNEKKEKQEQVSLLDILYALTKSMDNNARTLCKKNDKMSQEDLEKDLEKYIGKGLKDDIGIKIIPASGSDDDSLSILKRIIVSTETNPDEKTDVARVVVYIKKDGFFNSLIGTEKVDEKKYSDYKWTIVKQKSLSLAQRKQMALKQADSTDDTIDNNNDNIFNSDSDRIEKFYGFKFPVDCVTGSDNILAEAGQSP